MINFRIVCDNIGSTITGKGFKTLQEAEKGAREVIEEFSDKLDFEFNNEIEIVTTFYHE